ncbi:MAG TPA: hypothetical protein DEB39_16225 [Planctomycetaceae bacterium]|nr:hypothetical protein [Planctomycetaceae bacterium]
MLFSEPSATPYDWRFRFLGMSVRVHPFFWLIAVLLGPKEATADLGIVPLIVAWVVSVFISVFIHELGHALTLKYLFGANPWIAFYGMGGLTMHDPLYYRRRPGTAGNIFISFAGPFAGFLFAALLIGLWIFAGLFGAGFHVDVSAGLHPFVAYTFHFMIFISIVWGIFNLLPVYPLDGGQISREVFLWFSPRRGIVASLWISIVTAFAIVALCVSTKNLLPAILFGFLAFENYRTLSHYSRGYR